MTLQTEQQIADASHDDIIQVRLKDEAVIKYLSEGIYTSWKSAIRELFANELTAALTAKEIDPNANPTIEIRIDPEEREFTIQGIDSLGITQETFADKLIYYGRSGNASPKKLGRFGFGLKSYPAMGKDIRIETYARETGEKYGVVGSEGTHFRRIPDDELTISKYGSKVSITLRDDEREEEETSYSGRVTTVKHKIILFEDLIKTIRDVCRFSDVDTYLTITSEIKEKKYSSSYYDKGSFYESTVAKAGREKVSYTPQEFAEKTLGNKDLTKFAFELDDRNFYFYGILAPSGRDNTEVYVNPDNGEVRLLKMPIEVTVPESKRDHNGGVREVKPEYPMSWWFVNLKDETIFEPTPDRERLKEGLYLPVHEKIVSYLKGKFAEMEVNSFADYRNSQYREILRAHGNSDLGEFLTEKTRQVCDVLDVDVIPATTELEGTDRTHSRHRWGYSTGFKLRDLVLKSEHIYMLPRQLTRAGKGFVLPRKRAEINEKILKTKYSDAIVFMYPAVYQCWNFAEHLASIKQSQSVLTEQFGIKDARIEGDKIKKELGKDWPKTAGIEATPKERNKEIDEIVVWKSNSDYGRIEPTRVKSCEIGNEIVRISGNMKEWIDLLKKYSVRQYGVTKEIKGLKAGISEEEFRDHLSMTSVTTEDGPKRLDQVARSKRQVLIFYFCDPQILEYYKPKGFQVIRTKTSEETFEAVSYLKLSAKEFSVTEIVSRKGLAQKLKDKCGMTGKREGDHDKSIWSLVDFETDKKLNDNDWNKSQQDAINYLYMGLSMMALKDDENGASGKNHEGRTKLVSLLWHALSNVYETAKMKQLVKTAVKYYPTASRIEGRE
ncbi:MAG: hypothetical protein JRN20_13725 [Nitrososphaerota archaeon]|nr:hypothetical protein [Nitrososphaerota archaeon]